MHKRVISTIVTAVILFVSLCGMTTVFADDTSVPDASLEAEKLMRLGVLPETFVAEPTRLLTRAEATYLAVSLIHAEYTPVSPVSPFGDVDENTPYFQAIGAALELGIISGDADGYFRPDDLITQNEVLKVFVNLLGYGNLAMAKGGFPTGYLQQAVSLGLMITENASENITFGEWCRLAERAIDVDLMEIRMIEGDSVSFAAERGTTLLSYYRNIYKADGLVSVVGGTGIAGDAVSEGHAVIAGVQYVADQEYLMGYIGMEVVVYYQDDGRAEPEVLYVQPQNMVETILVDAHNIQGYAGGVYTYFENENASRSKKARLENAPYILYNGRLPSSSIANLYTPADGVVKLIDNDGNGAFDVAVITAYENFVVNGMDVDNGVIYDKYTPGKSLCISNYNTGDDRKLLTANGKEAFVSTLTEWTVITAAVSADGSYVRGTVCYDKKVGVVTGQSVASKGQYIEIDGVSIKLASNFIQSGEASKIQVGTSVEAYLDLAGEVAAVKFSQDGLALFGYVLDTMATGDINQTCQVYMMTADDEKTAYTLASKVKIDSVSYDEGQDMHRALQDGLANGPVVRYVLDGDGLIKEIDTPFLGEGENENTAIYEYLPKTDNLLYKSGSGNVEDAFYITADTMLVADYPAISDLEERFGIIDMSKLSNDTRYTFAAYATGDTFTPQVVVVTIANASGSVTYENMYVVESISKGMGPDGDGMVYDILSLWDGGAHSKLYCEEGVIQRKQIGVGDIIRRDVVKDVYLQNDYLVKVYDYTDNEILEGYYTDPSAATPVEKSTNASYATRLGFIYDRIGEYFSIAVADTIDEIADATKLVTTPPSSISVSSCRIENGRAVCQEITLDQFRPYTVFGDSCSKVLIRYRYRQPMQIFVIEKEGAR